LRVTGFPKATYHYIRKQSKRPDKDKVYKDALLKLREKNKDYGYKRLTPELKKLGYHINRKKVLRLMRELGILVTAFSHKSRKYKSYKGTVGKVASNRLKRRFNTSVPHQKITTDTTEFKYYYMDQLGNTQTGRLYLDPYMDLFNSEIISFQITKRPNGESMMEALKTAIERTNDCIFRRTFHSDQGWAYQMKRYSKTLKDNDIFQSMSRKGNCYDNSPMENFFSILKQEMYYGQTYHSFEELAESITTYINYYNEERIKEKLGWLSPVQYRSQYTNSIVFS
jgi:putative transposase